MDKEEKQKLLKAEKEKGSSLAKRLAQFAGTSALTRNYFRITSAGSPLGILMGTTGTPTFLKVQASDAKETQKILYALERGSSNALSAFQKVRAI